MAPYIKFNEQSIIKRTKVITSVDFEKSEVITDVEIRASVQPADEEVIQKEKLDYSLEYLMVHNSTVPLEINDFIVYKSKEYKIIRKLDYSDYGFVMPIAEEVK